MKIGDKVRFLSAVGGGVVTGFQGKDIALVEEEDGFETPVLIRECVVIESNEEQLRSPKVTTATAPATTEKPVTEQPAKENKEYDYEELPGGDILNLYLAYLPENIKDLVKGNYEAYLVNDSNYFLFVNYMSRENNSWKSIFHGLIEPNTKLFVHGFTKEDLNDLEHLCLQCLAFKKDKHYGLKNSYSVELKLDTVKFYKMHCFKENDFFDEEAIVCPVIRNDAPAKEIRVSGHELKEAMMQKTLEERRRPQPAQKKQTKQAVEELDLHAHELLETTAGMSNADILEYQLSKFREMMEKFKGKKGQKIVFIHGKGDGILRNAIYKELKLKYPDCSFQDASFLEYGFGATMVVIR